jgi:hypothetical protein
LKFLEVVPLRKICDIAVAATGTDKSLRTNLLDYVEFLGNSRLLALVSGFTRF